jgi:hypothetical protein
LRALVLGAFLEWRPHIETLLTAVWTGELAIDEHSTAATLAAGRLGVRRNDAVGHRFDRATLVAGEEEPRTKLGRRRRIARVGRPWKMIEDNSCLGARSAENQVSRAGQ